MIVGRLCRHSAGHKAFRSCGQHICPERHDCRRYNASSPTCRRSRKPFCLILADLKFGTRVSGSRSRTNARRRCPARSSVSQNWTAPDLMSDQNAGTPSVRDILPGSTGAMPPFVAQASPARHSSSGRRENANSSSAGRAPFSHRSLPVAPDRLCRRLRTKRVRIQDRRTRFSGRQSISKREHRPRQPSPEASIEFVQWFQRS